MQAGFDFFLVALVVDSQQAIEDSPTDDLAEDIALALLGGVKAVAQIYISLTVGSGHCVIQVYV